MKPDASPAYGPRPGQLLREAFDNLQQLGRRAVLAWLSVAIGSAAVVTLLNIGHNAALQAMQVFEQLGTDLLVASLHSEGTQGVSPVSAIADLQTVRQQIPGLLALSPLALTSLSARLHGHSVDVVVAGVGSQWPGMLKARLAHGRFLYPVDAGEAHVLLGAGIAAQWPAVRVGDAVQVGGYLFSIIGILHPVAHNPMLAASVDGSLLLPIESMRRLVPAPEVASVLAQGRDPADLPHLAERLGRILQSLWPGQRIEVNIARQLLEGRQQQARMFQWLLMGLGSVASLAAGIGVMNVMLMSVAERRVEIGVRMALGARPRDIACLFLCEALLLAACGAMAGCLAGLGLAWLFVSACDWPGFTLQTLSIPLGLGGSLLTALFFALYPAVQAARLQPVVALRDV